MVYQQTVYSVEMVSKFGVLDEFSLPMPARKQMLLVWLQGLTRAVMLTRERGVCDYCSVGPRVLRGSPFLADTGYNMCASCWKATKDEYWNASREFIPSFRAPPTPAQPPR